MHNLLEFVKNQEFEIALDLGCGPGETLIRRFRSVEFTVGFDINFDYISSAKDNSLKDKHKTIPHNSVMFVQGEGMQLPFKNECFDLVILSQVLEHVNDDGKIIQEISRVLKPRDVFLLSCPHNGLFAFLGPLNFKHYFPKVYAFLQLNKKSNRSAEAFHRYYSLSQLQNLLQGFKIKSIHRGGFLIRPLISVVGGVIIKFLWTDCLKTTRRILHRVASAELCLPFGSVSYDIFISATKLLKKGKMTYS